MRASVRALALAAILATLGASAARAFGDDVATRIEERVGETRDAAARRVAEVPVIGPVSERLRVSGSWLGVWLEPASGSQVRHREDASFDSWDARVFVDAELARDVRLGERPLLDAAGVSFEWEFYRLGQRSDQVGELYLDLQGLAGSPWWNVQIGRFQIPVGENYLRFGKAYRDNPFISNTVSGPWWWDEGVRIHGRSTSGRLGYVASLSSGETERNWGVDGGGQATLKLLVDPVPWLHLSASALWSGREDGDGAALWLGEAWGRTFGAGAGIPNLDDGRVVADGPHLDRTVYLGADAVLTHPRGARLWLGYGSYEIDSSGPSYYDRRLHGWIAELVVEGRAASPALRRFYAAVRANGLGSYDRGEGYLLDVRATGAFGYDMESLTAYSAAVGWRVIEWVTFKVEYTYQDVDLVRGAGALGLRNANASYFGAAVGFQF